MIALVETEWHGGGDTDTWCINKQKSQKVEVMSEHGKFGLSSSKFSSYLGGRWKCESYGNVRVYLWESVDAGKSNLIFI